jgi:DNA-binding MarR family transcriptional regulator
MHKQPVTHDFYSSLMEIMLTVRQKIIAVSSELGLTSIQAITIFLLDEACPRPMKEFCATYNCDASNITGIVDGLEKKGLVSRQNDPNDRRVKVIQLEPAGKKLQRFIIEGLSADSGFLFDPLNETEKQQFIHIVEKIAAVSAPTKKTQA